MTRGWVVVQIDRVSPSVSGAPPRPMWLRPEAGEDRPSWDSRRKKAARFAALEDAVAACLRVGSGRPVRFMMRGDEMLVFDLDVMP